MTNELNVNVGGDETPADPAQATTQTGPVEAEINVDTVESTPEAEPEAPEVPEKFRNEDGTLNQEALLQSYLELERSRQEAPPEPDKEPDKEEPTQSFEESMAKWADEWIQNDGSLSEATLKAIQEEHNVPSEFISDHMAAKQAQAREQVREVQALVGGEEQYNQMIRWAGKKLGKEEAQAFLGQVQDSITAGDQARTKSLMAGMEARWKASTGQAWAPELTDTTPDGEAIKPFNSREEMHAFQQTPEYKSNDPAIHKVFDMRLAKSKKQGIF